MVWIEAIVAFAVTMMALSTVVTMTVEMIHRVCRLRESGLRLMMEQVYTKVVEPQIASRLPKDSNDGKGFSDVITKPSFRPYKARIGTEKVGLFRKGVHKFLNVKKTKSLTALEFIEKFAKTDEGAILFEKGKERGEEYMKVVIMTL